MDELGEPLELGLTEGLTEADGLTLPLGDTDGELDDDGETLSDGETLGLSEADGDTEDEPAACGNSLRYCCCGGSGRQIAISVHFLQFFNPYANSPASESGWIGKQSHDPEG